MKTLRNVFFLLFIGLISLAEKCPAEDEPEADVLQSTLDLFQKKNWKITSVHKDADDITDFWGTDFVVNFGEASDPSGDDSELVNDLFGDFSSSGHDTEMVPEALYIWPESGAWGAMTKDDNEIISFTRFGELNTLVSREQKIIIEEVTDDILKLSFTITDPNARSNGLYEELWEFNFSN